MMRKAISVILCLLLLIAAFTGCSAASDETTAATESAGTTAETTEATDTTEGTPVGNGTLTLLDDPVELTFWIPVNDVKDTDEMAGQPWDEIVTDFEAAYPQVSVLLEGIGADFIEVGTSIWSTNAMMNNLPELVCFPDNMITSCQDTGVIIDCAPYLSDDYYAAYTGDAVANANTYATARGAVYMSPCCQEVEGWIFNTKMLDQYDLYVPVTWDEMLSVCSTLRDNGVLPIAQGGADDWAIWGYHEIANQYGWTKDQCDQFTAGGITTEQTGFYGQFQRLYELGEAGAFADDVSTTTFHEAGALFLEGKAAILQTNDSWTYTQMQLYDSDPDAYSSYYNTLMDSVFSFGFEFEDDIFDDGQVNGIKLNNWGVCVGSSAAQDDQKLAAAVAFIEFFVSEQEYDYWVDVSSNIPLSWTSDKAYDYSMWGLEQSYQEAYAEEGTWFHEPTDWATTLRDDYKTTVTGLLCGTLSVDDAVDIFSTWQKAAAGT